MFDHVKMRMEEEVISACSKPHMWLIMPLGEDLKNIQWMCKVRARDAQALEEGVILADGSECTMHEVLF